LSNIPFREEQPHQSDRSLARITESEHLASEEMQDESDGLKAQAPETQAITNSRKSKKVGVRRALKPAKRL
jgi:hypothetical protein